MRERNFTISYCGEQQCAIFVALWQFKGEELAGRGLQFIIAKECYTRIERWDRGRGSRAATRARVWLTREERKREKCATPRARSETLSEYWANTTVNEETFADHLRDLPRREYGLCESRNWKRKRGETFAHYPSTRFFCNDWNGYNFRKCPVSMAIKKMLRLHTPPD